MTLYRCIEDKDIDFVKKNIIIKILIIENVRWLQDLGTHTKNEKKKSRKRRRMNEFIVM